jgi:RimJ/RimL family protein N-acetyltransferase
MDKLKLPTRTETERLVLRCYAPGDGPMYFAAAERNREHLREFESGNVLMELHSEAQAEKVVRELAADWEAGNCFFLGAFEKTSGDFVAQVYVGPVNRALPEYEIGYIADCDHEGKGYVSEAVRAVVRILFETMGAHRLRLACDETNLRSIRLAERCGFVREGHRRETKRRLDGSYTGDVFYGMLRSEYETIAK